MLHIGCHLSSSGGFYKMGETALKIGADTFQFFTRNPRGSKAKEIDPDDAKSFLSLWRKIVFPVFWHTLLTPWTRAPQTKTRGNLRLIQWPTTLGGWNSLRIRCTIFTPAVIQVSELKTVLSWYRVSLTGYWQRGRLPPCFWKPWQERAQRSAKALMSFEKYSTVSNWMKSRRVPWHVPRFDAGYDIVNSLDEVLTDLTE